MTRVLLTGGSGFIAAHILETLLSRGHSVVTTVRSQDKAEKIHSAHSKYPREKLATVIVPDMAVEHAFDKAVVTDPPLDAVIHAASPFHFNAKDVQKDLLDPAIIGTTGILRSIQAHAPGVKRVVITSSFAAIIHPFKGSRPGHTYSEKDWSPITEKDAHENPMNGYRASKKLAEKAAWDFVEQEKPNFTLVTMNPPLVLGPIVHYLNSIEGLNTSNQRVRDMMQGKWREKMGPTGTFVWVDVRDLAEGHVLALEKEEAQGKRYFFTAGHFNNEQIAGILRKNFPELKDKLPLENAEGGGWPEEGVFEIDNSRTKELMGGKFRSLEESVVDTARSLEPFLKE